MQRGHYTARVMKDVGGGVRSWRCDDGEVSDTELPNYRHALGLARQVAGLEYLLFYTLQRPK